MVLYSVLSACTGRIVGCEALLYFFCSSTYFTRTIHLVLAYLATLIPLVKVYSVIDVWFFFSGVGVSLLLLNSAVRVNVVHNSS